MAADFGDRSDVDDADRGFVGKLDQCIMRDADARVVWDNDAYAFLDAECPDTAHPSVPTDDGTCHVPSSWPIMLVFDTLAARRAAGITRCVPGSAASSTGWGPRSCSTG